MGNEISKKVEQAIANDEAIEVTYVNYDGEGSKRVLSDLSYTDKFDAYGYDKQHFRAFCHKRQEERSFKIDRISAIRIVEKPLVQEVEVIEPKLEPSKSKQGSEDCYIATMVYGDYDHYQVKILRGFRDNTLLKSYLGTCFVKFSHSYSFE